MGAGLWLWIRAAAGAPFSRSHHAQQRGPRDGRSPWRQPHRATGFQNVPASPQASKPTALDREGGHNVPPRPGAPEHDVIPLSGNLHNFTEKSGQIFN